MRCACRIRTPVPERATGAGGPASIGPATRARTGVRGWPSILPARPASATGNGPASAGPAATARGATIGCPTRCDLTTGTGRAAGADLSARTRCAASSNLATRARRAASSILAAT